ncbi:DUF190 domain-containing protein [Desulfovulcanus sp.]
MRLPEQAERIRIFIGEDDKFDNKPLYEQIVLKAREMGLAGATVLHGVLGYGANSRIHSSKILRLSEDMPLVIEIVDTSDKINAFLKTIDPMLKEGLITKEPVQVIFYRHK